jgi:hypothetical protein
VINLGLTAVLAAGAARADCVDEVQAARGRLATIQNPAEHEEVSRLLDKAEKDGRAGRERLCIDALVRAQALIK